MSDNSPADIWRFVSGKEGAIANHLRSLAPVLPPAIRKRVARVASQIDRVGKQDGLDANAQQKALEDVDLVAIVSPLLERARDGQNDKPLGEAELLSDLQVGVCRLVRCSTQRRSMVGLLTYPGLLLVGVVGITLLFSQLILPEFRKMFSEFGIELPTVTKSIFAIGSFLEAVWPLVLLLACLAALPLVVDLCRSMGVATGLVKWVENIFSSKRSAIAAWARHTALLLQAGIDEDVAVKTSLSAAKGWMRGGTWPWRFGLAERVLNLEDTSAKIALLNHTADYYHARHRSAFQWWTSFLPPIVVCLLGAWVAFLMLSIFMPLIAIIGGLSGGFIVGLSGILISGLSGGVF